tara:strand:+ start:99 stop:560 length:462 start_codon:yes stop_codon:yes gene_type:complete
MVSITNNLNSSTLDPTVWGPHYWFMLHTIAISYPLRPNEVTRKKYYDFIQNIPLFIPIQEISNSFSKLLDAYPVTPYLDSRNSFTKWMHFIHNKVRKQTGDTELTLEEALNEYKKHYIPKKQIDIDKKNSRTIKIYGVTCLALFLISLYIHKK